ncbi:myosin-10-like [Littorina saxatilis]|uniref:myosin-10-like n=1 Tax=Littorina saxatilis TaxID=31220 RepID=UPI0038B55DC0
MAEHSDTGGSTYDHYLALGEKHGLKAEALFKFAQDHMDREERIQEREAKKVAAEAEVEAKKIEAEAETKRQETEVKKLQIEANRELDAKRLEADTEARRMDLEFKKAEAQQSTGGNAGGRSGPSIRPQYPKLPMFKEDKDDIDSFLFRFETHAKANKWNDSEWATYLSAYLEGGALSLFHSLFSTGTLSYEDLKKELLKKFQCTREGFREKFRSTKPEADESFGTYGVGLCADVSHKKITEEVVLEKVVCGTSRAKAKKKLEDSPVPLKNVVTPDLSVKEEDLKSLLREDETLEEVLSVSREDEKYAVCAEKVVDVEEVGSDYGESITLRSDWGSHDVFPSKGGEANVAVLPLTEERKTLPLPTLPKGKEETIGDIVFDPGLTGGQKDEMKQMAEHSDTGGSTYDHYLALGEKHGLKAEALFKFAQDHMDREERIQEREAKKVAAEAEVEAKKVAAEVEAKKQETEVKKLQIEANRELDAKRLEADTEARRMDLEFKKAEAQQSTGGNAGGRSGPSIRPQYPKLPMFKEDKDDIDSFLFRFETHAKANKWNDSEWATYLSAYLEGGALSLFHSLFSTGTLSYEDLKKELLKKFQCTREGFREKFRSTKPEADESFGTYGVGLCADVSHKKITEEVVLEKVVCGTRRAKAKKKLEDFPVPLKNVVTPDLSVKEEDLKSLLREDETLEEVLSVSREDEKYAGCAEKVVDVEEVGSDYCESITLRSDWGSHDVFPSKGGEANVAVLPLTEERKTLPLPTLPKGKEETIGDIVFDPGLTGGQKDEMKQMAEHSDTGGSTYDHYLALGEKHGLKAEALFKFAQDHMDREERIQEREAKKVAAEAEVEAKKIEAEAETKRQETEVKKLQIEANRELDAKRLEADTEARRMDLEFKKAEAQQSTGGNAGGRSGPSIRPQYPKLPMFKEDKDDIDSFLFRFETHAKANKWNDSEWATYLSAYLEGGALSLFHSLFSTGTLSYEDLKKELLKKFQCTREGCREKFRSTKPEADESFGTYFGHYARECIQVAYSAKSVADCQDAGVLGVGLCADVSHKKITEEVVLEKVVCGTSRAKAKKKLEDSPVPLKNVVTPDLSVKEEDLKSLLREDETLEEVLSVSREDEKYAGCAEEVVDVEEPWVPIVPKCISIDKAYLHAAHRQSAVVCAARTVPV